MLFPLASGERDSPRPGQGQAPCPHPHWAGVRMSGSRPRGPCWRLLQHLTRLLLAISCQVLPISRPQGCVSDVPHSKPPRFSRFTQSLNSAGPESQRDRPSAREEKQHQLCLPSWETFPRREYKLRLPKAHLKNKQVTLPKEEMRAGERWPELTGCRTMVQTSLWPSDKAFQA